MNRNNVDLIQISAGANLNGAFFCDDNWWRSEITFFVRMEYSAMENMNSATIPKRLNRTLTVSMNGAQREAIQTAANESSMTVSGYVSQLLSLQNPEGFPIFKRIVVGSQADFK